MRVSALLCIAPFLCACWHLHGHPPYEDEADMDYGEPWVPDIGPVDEPDMPYTWVHIVDESEMDVGDGRTGVDICGVVVDCGDGPLVGISAEVTPGEGRVCDGVSQEQPCQAGLDRQNPGAALDDGQQCRPARNDEPPSDTVSLGLGGELAVEFPVDLRGCSLLVVEYSGRMFEAYDETYEVFVCQGVRGATPCLREGWPIDRSPSTGERIEVQIPQE